MITVPLRGRRPWKCGATMNRSGPLPTRCSRPMGSSHSSVDVGCQPHVGIDAVTSTSPTPPATGIAIDVVDSVKVQAGRG